MAIVGGGMTGAVIAHTFAEAGVSVALLEAARVGRGSTAASSALLLQEPDQGLTQLVRRYGAARARRIWQLSHDAVRQFLSVLRELPRGSGLVERDTTYYATSAEAGRELRIEQRRRVEAGFDAEWLTAGALRRVAGIPGFGAIRTEGNAQFDPYSACIGLLTAAAGSGADVFEHSPVTRIDSASDRVRVHTRGGRVDAKRVIIATGYATSGFKPLAGRFSMYHTYVLATERLRQSQRNEIGFADVMAWDTERPYHYARWTPDNRLLLGGCDRRVRPGDRRAAQFADATRELREDFERLLPALADVKIEAAWEGLFAVTPDSLPYIGPHQRYPGHLFALGYGGNGMTFGFLAGRILLEHWNGIRAPEHDLFRFGRFR